MEYSRLARAKALYQLGRVSDAILQLEVRRLAAAAGRRLCTAHAAAHPALAPAMLENQNDLRGWAA